jgi:hypothetical protein
LGFTGRKKKNEKCSSGEDEMIKILSQAGALKYKIAG